MIWVATFLILAAVSSIGLGVAGHEPHEPIEIDRGICVAGGDHLTD